MLYPKNTHAMLDTALFTNPTSEYRGTPFWAWNTQLHKEELLSQINTLKQMGMGGFHVHSRSGMGTPYLSDEFMDLVKSTADKAIQEDMLLWLYDEDRWPSGFGGGFVTSQPEYRCKYLLFTPFSYEEKGPQIASTSSSTRASRANNGELICRYWVTLHADGTLAHYRQLGSDEPSPSAPDGTLWYAYLETLRPRAWYNNSYYVNTLDRKAIERFVQITHERYKQELGQHFGRLIPAIFSDEPQFPHKTTLSFAQEQKDVIIPWSGDLPETFSSAYGESIWDKLPELFWELPDGKLSRFRYRYHDHIAERFAGGFADTIGSWCAQNGIMLTGHMMDEPTLNSQSGALGEAMRSYRSFQLPGIDMLCDRREFTTAKQAQSAAHQYGRPGVLSELYGVTNWDFDFRGHKLQGDWQAALGITVRVHHLSWVSMKGEAKRDYPASINYQSPWHTRYKQVEDHFARVNTAMTRGKPIVKIGMIHPIESYWMRFGPNDVTREERQYFETQFSNLTQWLLLGQMDFDYIAESLLPGQCPKGGAPLQVGEMAYDVIIVPRLRTIRKTTLDRLAAFAHDGGQIILVGQPPDHVDGDAGQMALAKSLEELPNVVQIGLSRFELLSALEPKRLVGIFDEMGCRSEQILYQLRQDGDCRWLFLSQAQRIAQEDSASLRKLRVDLAGQWTLEEYNTLNGEIRPIASTYVGGNTRLIWPCHCHDSLLLRLTPAISNNVSLPEAKAALWDEPKRYLEPVPYRLAEPNVCLLDFAQYALDDGPWREGEELLRLDNILRTELGYPLRGSGIAQPWAIPAQVPEHTIRLRFTIHSEIDLEQISLALEDAHTATILWNGAPIPNQSNGWFTDRDIKTVPLPSLRKGENTLEVHQPFGQRTNTEWMYILGDFAVTLQGSRCILTRMPRKIGFGDIVPQGFPFYGGNIHYDLPLTGTGGDILVKSSYYRGSLVDVALDGQLMGSIIYAPYEMLLPAVPKGGHTLTLTLYGNRVNSFGAVHNCDESFFWFGPDSWRTQGSKWSYEYQLRKTGILKSPEIFYQAP